MALDFPSNPVDGQVFGSYVWSSSKGVWQSREESAAVAVTSPTAPTEANNGDLWYNTSRGVTYIYYNDGSSSQWVEVVTSGTPELSTKADLSYTNEQLDTKADLDGGNTFTGDQVLTTPLAVSSGGTGSGTVSGAQASLQMPLSPNYIINGGFDIWQRGNTFSNPASGAYLADRWATFWNGSGATRTVSRQTFTPGAAPVAGYEAESFFRFAQTVAGTSGTFNVIQHRVEDVRTLAGQIVTISFWAKSDSARTISIIPFQNFGTGGSSQVLVTSQSVTLSTSWNRYSLSFSIPSLTGKTIGTNSYLGIEFSFPVNAVGTFDFWGVQLEQGQVATPFRRNSNSIQAELAACQRYYQRIDSSDQANRFLGSVAYYQTTLAVALVPLVTQMRRVPDVSISATNTFQVLTAQVNVTPSGVTVNTTDTSPTMLAFNITTSVITTTAAGSFRANNTVNTRIEASAEL